MILKNTAFRIWLNRKWIDYQEELSEIGQDPDCKTSTDYFRKYRWWLKSQFKLENTHHPG